MTIGRYKFGILIGLNGERYGILQIYIQRLNNYKLMLPSEFMDIKKASTLLCFKQVRRKWQVPT